jgi:hypothetical protein
MLRSSLRIVLWLASLAVLAGYLIMVSHDLRPPRALDASERALLVHAERLAADEPLYREPPANSSLPIMPGFPWALSLLINVLGSRTWEPRAMATAALLACALLLAIVIASETGSRTMAAVGAGVLLLGSTLLTPPAAQGQAEVLALLLVLAAFLSIRRVGEITGALLGALLLACACFTTVLALPFLLVAFIHCTVSGTRSGVAFTLGTAAFLGGGYLWLSKTLGPWFNYQVSDALLQSLHFDGAGLLHLLGGHLLGTFGVLSLTIVLSFGLPVRPWRGAVGLWTWLAIGGVVASALASQSVSLASHALLPAIVALALAGPLAMQRVTRHLSAWPGATKLGGESMVLAALALQFLQLMASAPSLPLRM